MQQITLIWCLADVKKVQIVNMNKKDLIYKQVFQILSEIKQPQGLQIYKPNSVPTNDMNLQLIDDSVFFVCPGQHLSKKQTQKPKNVLYKSQIIRRNTFVQKEDPVVQAVVPAVVPAADMCIVKIRHGIIQNQLKISKEQNLQRLHELAAEIFLIDKHFLKHQFQEFQIVKQRLKKTTLKGFFAADGLFWQSIRIKQVQQIRDGKFPLHFYGEYKGG